ncbi:hypothetical protein ACNFH5_16215 [Pseudomonas sp. NY15435]|uniref:hypothetical protein n=1 Tax=Pseudomonas sp. NY15435 TaxID=3400358 RepID=UPI003A837120
MKRSLETDGKTQNARTSNNSWGHRYTSRAILFPFTAIALTGLISPLSYNLLPADILFEAVFLIATISLLSPPKKSQIKYALAASLYITISFGLMEIFRPANILDFAQAYKAFFYIVPLSFYVGRSKFNKREIIYLLRILLTIFLVKYGYSRILNLTPRMGERPGIFVENNFELIFIIILFYISEENLKNLERALSTAAVIAIVFLSGSRSALAALIVTFLFIHVRSTNAKTVIAITVTLALTIGAAFIFINRMDGSIETIDRVYFLQIFLDETKDWDALKYTLGSMPLTPLSDHSCTALSAYSALYSYSGDDSCYSVILHSFILRVIFDHGALGLVFILHFVLQALKRSNYSPKKRLCISLTILISAFSVSAFNSVFTSLALAIAFSYPQTPNES